MEKNVFFFPAILMILLLVVFLFRFSFNFDLPGNCSMSIDIYSICQATRNTVREAKRSDESDREKKLQDVLFFCHLTQMNDILNLLLSLTL